MPPNGSKIRRGETPHLGVACENPLLLRKRPSSLFCVRTHRFQFSANRKTTQNRTQRFRYIDLPLSIRDHGVTRSYSLITDVTLRRRNGGCAKRSAANLRHKESSHKTFAGGTVETFVVERRKIFQYVGLFLSLVFVYAVALSRYLDFVSADGKVGGPVINTPLDLMPPIIRFCILSALPFAGLACYEKNWRSSDAAAICAAAWAIVAAGFMVKLHTNCIILVAFPSPPFIASATVGHAAGRATRFIFDKAVSNRPVSS
jgi:hypothetical protein